MRYLCDTCGKSYQHKRNLKRHVKERHCTLEYWNCVEENCSSRFIRRSYLSRHLAWTHGYNKTDAREAAINATRGDNPTQYGDREEISDDDTILDLLAERDQTVTFQDYCDKIDGFDTDILDNDATEIVQIDIDDILEGDIDIDVFEGVPYGHINENDHEVNNDGVDSVHMNDGDGNDGENGDGDGRENVMNSDNESVIIVSSDDEEIVTDGTVVTTNDRTVVQTLVLIFTKRQRYNNDTLVNTSTTLEKEVYTYTE